MDTKKELKQHNLSPIKHRGQNFLVSKEIIEKIIEAAKVKKGEKILEVGPGTGNLTKALLESGAIVVSVEKDKNLIKLLKIKSQNSNLKIIEGDILKFDETILKSPYRIIANIPYYLTGALIQKFLLAKNKPGEMILMVQKEVGERITAQPPRANFLSSLTQFLAEAEILFKVGKENFWPQPKVDSVLIRLTPRHVNIPKRSPYFVNIDSYIEFLKVVFRQPRQTLFNNLRKSGLIKPEKLEKIYGGLGFDKKIRPQNLGLEQLLKIFLAVKTLHY